MCIRDSNIVLNEFNYIEEINKTLVAKVLEAADEPGEDFDDRCSVCIDFDLIKGNLRARNRRQGDSMTPCGMKGSKKIKDIFIDLKIPKDERDSKLIIADDENIISVSYTHLDVYKRQIYNFSYILYKRVQ